MLKLVGGVLAIAIGVSVICWVAFNLLVSRRPSFQMRSLGGLGVMAVFIVVGAKWVKEGWGDVQGAARPKPQKKKRRRPVAEHE